MMKYVKYFDYCNIYLGFQDYFGMVNIIDNL